MLIPVFIKDDRIVKKSIEGELKSLEELGLQEEQLIDFIRANIDTILDEGKKIIIVGELQSTIGGLKELYAIDSHGNFVIIAISLKSSFKGYYGNPVSLLKNANYFAECNNLYSLIDMLSTSGCKLKRIKSTIEIINWFLAIYDAEKNFNKKQRLVLITTSFEAKTIKVISSLVYYGADFKCIQIQPIKFDDQIMLSVETVSPLPPKKIKDKKIKPPSEDTLANFLHEIIPYFEQEFLNCGDLISIPGLPNSKAIIKDANHVIFDGIEMHYETWGDIVTGGYNDFYINEWLVNGKK